ncbi:MAG: LamG-like jellyroll fold domain-containing protein [Nanoarchaeota archaeon]|nr:LamG-like jellyroll fold domain-containing protein [Nanoarchaeota archaeon]
MKRKSKKVVRKIPRNPKTKSLPKTSSSPKNSSLPKKNADKTFLIAIISIVAVAVLFLLLLFSGQFVGKAFFSGQSNNAGVADPGTILENQPFSLTVQVNVPAPAKTNAVGFTLQLPTVVGVPDVCSKVVDVDNDASNGINVQNLFGGFETKNKCENNKILFGSSIVGTKSGTITVAKIDFQGLPQGSYSFAFVGQFEAYDAGNLIAITVLDPVIEVQEQQQQQIPVQAICGNGIPEGAEQCDNGANNADTKACTSVCTNNVCGDGKTYLSVEQCDDGNNIDGDLCSSSCEAEAGATCGDNICDVKQESTSTCPQDCGLVCPTNGLLFWWKGENNAQDSYKFGHHGTIEGAAAYMSGRVGQAFKFDGKDDLIDLGLTSEDKDTEEFLLADPTEKSLSVSFWMKTAATKSPQGSMYMIDSGAGTESKRGFYCNTAQGSLYCAVRQATVIYKVAASNVIPLNSWKYVTLTFDDETDELKLYVDGALSKTGNEQQIFSTTYVSTKAVIGATNTKQLLFNGSLDEIGIWSRALSGGEIKSLYDAGATGMCSITAFVCGNGVQESGEDCDDGNLVDSDGCSSTCQTESAICGDSVCEIKFESTVACPQDCGLVCPTNGLVSWWKGEDTQDSFSSHHGINVGENAKQVSGKVDDALYFDGDGDYFSLGQKPGTIFADPTGSSLSVSFWIRTNATKGPQNAALYILDSGAGTASRTGFYCSTSQGKLDCAIKHADTIYQVSANNAIPLNVWKLITFTFNDATEELKLYVDGASVATGTKAALSSSSSPVPTSVIGATNLQTLSFNGTLDEIAIWNRVLTLAEVNAIFGKSDIGMCAVPEAICGNGFVETGEECDDANVIATDACNLCNNAICGDGIIKTGLEQCDGNNLAEASCQTLEFASGSLSCTAGCFFNSTACKAASPAVTSTVNGTKISLGEITPASNNFSTLVTAIESFSQKVFVYTVLYDADGKVLKLESDELAGGMVKDAWRVVTANHPQAEVKKKTVLVFDVEPNPKVYAKLEEVYS